MNAVELEHVTVAYGTHEVATELCFTLGRRERVALMGNNGAGKSTLIDVMLGMIRPQRGTVRVLGRTPPSPQVGLVPQDPRASLLPWLSVHDNVCMPLRLRGATRDQCARALDEVRAALDPHHSLDLGARPATLSPGQAQLATWLRALIGAPQLLLCDEPFSALDAGTGERIRLALQQQLASPERPALVLVCHDADHARQLCERRLELRSGALHTRDTTERQA